MGSLSAGLAYNIQKDNMEIAEWDRYLLLGKENIFVVYENKLAIKIPYDLHRDKDKTFGDMAKSKNYQEILEEINSLLPEKVEKYKSIRFGKIELDVENSKNIPEDVIDDKKYIATSAIEGLFNEYYREKPLVEEIENSEIIVDILNANGRAGYARQTGEKLKKDMGLRYNAANYENQTDYSYVIVNKLTMEKSGEILEKLNEKYFKIKEETSVPTMAHIIVVLGKEQNQLLEVNVSGDEKKAAEASLQLRKLGYKGVKSVKGQSGNESTVEYNPEDYFTAYKLAKKLNIEKLVENKNLKEKINVVLN